MEDKSGILIISHLDGSYYILYENGKVLFTLKEEEGILKPVSEFDVKHPLWVSMVFFEPMENMDKVVYLFITNIAYGIILRSGKEHLISNVMKYLASSDIFKYEEGQIKYRKDPTNREDVLNFMSFLLDAGYSLLGEKRFSEELEYSLQPYKELFNVLNVQEYIKSYIEG